MNRSTVDDVVTVSTSKIITELCIEELWITQKTKPVKKLMATKISQFHLLLASTK